MKKKLITLLSLSLITANMAFAEYAFVDSSDFTGDAFFTPPALARSLEDALEEQFYYTSSLTDSSVNVKVQLDELKQQLANVKKLGTEEFDETISLPLGQPRSYWLFANAYKPVEVAAKLKLPIFVLQGERDYQVTMEDFGLWRSGLLRCKNAYFKSYPKLNHLLQEGSGKATPFEYSHASPVPAYVMDDIASFVRGKQNTL